MEKFKNTIEKGIQETIKDQHDVFNFIYTMSSQKEIYEWLLNLQLRAWDEDDYQWYIDRRAYMNSDRG
tara:strand:- start:7560 stop:7763 length:204 start_codon:yes stop_codon:yes gene_type:complete